MKEQYKIWFTLLVFIMIVCSMFIVTFQYYDSTYLTKDDLPIVDSIDTNNSDNVTTPINTPPMVKIIVDKTTGFRPETINFDANVFDLDGDNVTYKWTITYPPFFSKERIDTYNEKNFSLTVLRNGNYVASLTVTDEAGNSVTEHLRIDIKPSRLEVAIGSILYTLTTLTTAYNIILFVLDLLRGNETNESVVLSQKTTVNDDDVPFGCGFLITLTFIFCVLSPYSILCNMLIFITTTWCDMKWSQNCSFCPT